MSSVAPSDRFSELHNNTTIGDGDDEPTFVRNRVFVNLVDSFRGGHLASFLTDQVFGASKTAGDAPEEEEEEDVIVTPKLAAKYEVIGTTKQKLSEDVLYAVDEADDGFLGEVMKCGFVVYDITGDADEIPKATNTLKMIANEIDRMKEAGPKTFASHTELRVFVLLSTVMTWGLTRPIDPDDPEIPFSESDYKKRRPHPNYKEHIACEREVVLKGRKYRDKLRTFVVCSGIVYGREEDDLSFFFERAWKNEAQLPVFGAGDNLVPLIHIADLCRVIHGVLETSPKKPQYILAVEQTPCTLKQIVTAVSEELGSGKIKTTPAVEAFLYAEMTQKVYERCTVDLNMQPGFVTDVLELEWKNERNLAENAAEIAEEFRKARRLTPMRVFIHGPPAVGKTTLAERLCEVYGSRRVTVELAVETAIEELKARMGAEEDDDDDVSGKIRALSGGTLPEDEVARLVQNHLSSNACRNQGYVLDGYPETIEQAAAVFGAAGELDGEGDDDEGAAKIPILPDRVIALQATDEFLCARLTSLTEEELLDTGFTEEKMLRELEEFRRADAEDDTVLNYFDEIEIHPIVVDVGEYADVDAVVEHIVQQLGPVTTLGPTAEEEAETFRCAEDARRLKQEEDDLERERDELLAARNYQDSMEEWSSALETLQREEEKLMIAESEPLRNYLVKFVFPVLTKGLLEVARLRPLDPVDFLAEYLFKENPEGRMFDPSYTKLGARLSPPNGKAANESSL